MGSILCKPCYLCYLINERLEQFIRFICDQLIMNPPNAVFTCEAAPPLGQVENIVWRYHLLVILCLQFLANPIGRIDKPQY